MAWWGDWGEGLDGWLLPDLQELARNQATYLTHLEGERIELNWHDLCW